MGSHQRRLSEKVVVVRCRWPKDVTDEQHLKDLYRNKMYRILKKVKKILSPKIARGKFNFVPKPRELINAIFEEQKGRTQFVQRKDALSLYEQIEAKISKIMIIKDGEPNQ